MSGHVTDLTSEPLVSTEGWLCIRRNIHEDFRIRWFVLKGNLLFYYERNGSTEPIGVIKLEGCNIDFDKDDILFYFKIEFFGPNNDSYMLGAKSQESMEQWIKSLKCASRNCVKSAVANWENSLEKLKDKEIKVSYTIKMIEPTQTNKRLSSENLSPTSISALGCFHHIVPYGGCSRSPPKRGGYTPNTTFKTIHTEFGKIIIKNRNERLRLFKNNNKPL